MENKNFNICFLIDRYPRDVYNSINNVRGWWSEKIIGDTLDLNDEFSYRHGDVHFSKHKIIETIQDKRVVWLTMESKLNFVKTKDEWNGTKVIFEISKKANRTKLDITHLGLVPNLECYDGCSKGWSHYFKDSLLSLINTGQGIPD